MIPAEYPATADQVTADALIRYWTAVAANRSRTLAALGATPSTDLAAAVTIVYLLRTILDVAPLRANDVALDLWHACDDSAVLAEAVDDWCRLYGLTRVAA